MRLPMLAVIAELEQALGNAVTARKDERYYAYAHALDILRRNFPEMDEKRWSKTRTY